MGYLWESQTKRRGFSREYYVNPDVLRDLAY